MVGFLSGFEHPSLRTRDRQSVFDDAITDAVQMFGAQVRSRSLPNPQPGAQSTFYQSEADITIFGGAAGAGKSRALLLRASKWAETPGYGAVIFRLTSPELTNEGGLWDESKKVYQNIKGARAREGDLDWSFTWGSAISFRHADRLQQKFYGAQAAYIGIDELQFWKEEDFWFLLSRNRSTCGVVPKLDATCNPDCDSFVADLISWWIDPESGYPIPERSGVVRYFYRIEEEVIWRNTPEELQEEYPDLAAIAPPKSLTFIKGTIYDNPELIRTNPQYLANLLSQSPVLKERLLNGNWKIRLNRNDVLFAADAIERGKTGRWVAERAVDHHYMAMIDPAYGGKNFFVCQVWDITKLPFSLAAEYRQNYRSPQHSKTEAVKLIKKFKCFFLAVETDNGGTVIAENIQTECPDVRVETTRASAIAKIINTDRIARAVEDGTVEYPPDWIGIQEMENFSALTRSAIKETEVINDDTITCWAAGWAWLEVAIAAKPREVMKGYFVDEW